MQNKDQMIRIAKSFGLIALLFVGVRFFGALPCILGYLAGRFVYSKLRVQYPAGVLPLVAGIAVCVAVALVVSIGFSIALGGVLQTSQ